MPIELKMPALSPTMEEGTLAKWLVKEGDDVKSGDILAEIETDKATMEFEAVDEGKIAKILVPEGTDGVKVGAPIAILAGEGEERRRAALRPRPTPPPPTPPKRRRLSPKADATPKAAPPPQAPVETPAAPPQPAAAPRAEGDRVKASPLARRLAAGAGHRPVEPHRAAARAAGSSAPTSTPRSARRLPLRQLARQPPRRRSARTLVTPGPMEQAIPHEAVKLSQHAQDDRAPPDRVEAAGPAHLSDRRHPARRAAQAARRAQRRPRKPRRQAQSVNDLLIKALAQALIEVPECNVSFAGDS